MRALRWILLGIACLVAIGSGAHFAQRRLLFPAPPTPAHPPALDEGIEHTWLETPGGRVEAFLLPPDPPVDGPRPLVVYAHGNGELVDFWLAGFAPLRAEGVSVLLVEYPGYGRSSGAPSEASIRDALTAGYDWARSKPGVDPERIIGYGRSLGGGAICALGRVRSLVALVLESTFTSVEDMAAERFGAPRFLAPKGFDNLEFVSTYASPILLLHGEDDQLVPSSQAHRLAAAAHGAQLHLEKCGHGCGGQWPVVLRFLREHDLL